MQHSQIGLRIACTGFVSQAAGSVASANALLLGALLDQGIEIDFFSKPSFVDPRPIVGGRGGFRFVPVINRWSDGFRRRVQSVPVLGSVAGQGDASCYNRLLVRRMRSEHITRHYDLILWLGDFAHGAVAGVPTVSFVQGPPGTDARSVMARWREIRDLAGIVAAARWWLLARLRLSRLGLPAFRHTDHFIVGSLQSKQTLCELYAVQAEKISTLPYPIDLELFRPAFPGKERTEGGLRVLWLGRIIPRKRLDVFLQGAAQALREGCDLRLTIVGQVGFIPGYEKWIKTFPFPERLSWIKGMDREVVPALLRQHDLLVQPSDEENFGSSVAEAQACGLPVIVGRTNGNADYLCARDIHLNDDKPAAFARILRETARRKQGASWGEPATSRVLAEQCFALDKVAEALLGILKNNLKV